jgi:2-oxoadipate dioxygenase/decarboxylase-like protein
VTTSELLDVLWRDYVASTPQAERIHQLMQERGEIVRNDHVALRTYGAPAIDIAALARPFEALGWRARDSYRFADKHLRARYWQHPDPELPKVFISELVLAELSPEANAIVARLLAQLPEDFGRRADLPWAGRPWRVTYAEYQQLLAESEYAAWVAAFGFRVNHFTVDVRSLSTFPDLAALNALLVEHGFQLNDSGGTIKGTPADRLEQSSTRADAVDVAFADATVRIPSCYYEFARRYPLPNGELFHGFVPASADKIFESTDVKR